MHIFSRPFVAAVVCGAVLMAASADTYAQALPSFSGADGAASTTAGGRGGVVYHVTKLDLNFSDTGPGTLRYGLSDGNFTVGGVVQPRTIVFDVAGTFWLGRYGAEREHDNGWDTQSRINWGSHVTIAGQTAPGPVYIMGGVTKANGTNNIIRNVTIAPGYGMRNFSKPEDGVFPTPGDFPDAYVYDAIDISGTNIMIDHVSTLYATDETISANELANNVTIQYSNISQGQNYPQLDAEGGGYTGHALGSLLQGGTGAKFSLHHNLYAHQKGRMPRVGSEVGTGAFNDFRNNVFYNWLGTAGAGASGQPSYNNFVGNFYLAGPGGDDVSGTNVVNASGGTSIFSGGSTSATRVHHVDNVRDTNKDSDALDTSVLTNSNFTSSTYSATPYWFQSVPTYNGVTDSAIDAYDRVLDYMGAQWWTRDDVIDTPDERIIHEVRTGTGKIMAWADDPFNSSASEGTEWRNMLDLRANPTTGAAPFARDANWDVDLDGMPADWEQLHGLNPLIADNNGDFDTDGYTNLEEYINELAEWPAPGVIVFGGATNNRYAQITNWDVNPSATSTGYWQPSKFDTAEVRSGTAVVDAVGQHAGTLRIAPAAGQSATLQVTAGWIDIASELTVGAAGQGTVDHTGGVVAADSIVLGGAAGANGGYQLTGTAALRVGTLSKGTTGGTFSFTGGTLHADVVDFDLAVAGGTVAPGLGIGTTLVAGDASFASASTLAIDYQGDLADRLLVTGNLDLGTDTTLSVTELGALTTPSLVIAEYMGTLTGKFQSVTTGYVVDYSVPGQIRLALAPAGLAGDYNDDGVVDAADYTLWRDNMGAAPGTLPNDPAGGIIGTAQYEQWVANFGMSQAESQIATASVPEPATLVIVLATCMVNLLRRAEED